MLNKNSLVALVFLVVVLNIVSSTIVVKESYSLSNHQAIATGQADATMSLCINQKPSIIFNCSTNLTQGTPYFCQLNGSDPENNSISFFEIPQELDENGDSWFILNVSSTGTINFTPSNAQVGDNHSTRLCVDDNLACSNSQTCKSFNFSIANINDPPYLVMDIPDQKFEHQSSMFAFLLNDYFADPDGDALVYTYQTLSTSASFNVTIYDNSMVEFSSDYCADMLIKFTATDPYSATAESNLVSVKSTCEDDQGENEDGAGEQGGGGGGGAGPVCKTEWYCLPWSKCFSAGWKTQVCYDLGGCKKEKRYKEKCDYPVTEECVENWLCEDWQVCQPNGFQNRTCQDLKNCDSELNKPVLERKCNYVPTCFDGIKNGAETGVDCGGPCSPCELVEMPKPLGEKDFTFLLTSLAIILILTILTSLFVIYREQIYETIAQAGWAFSKKKNKQELLSSQDKKIMFESINNFEKDYDDSSIENYEKLGAIIRKYFSLALQIDFEYELQEVVDKFEKINLYEELRYVLETFVKKGFQLENYRGSTNKEFVKAITEELRLIVCMTSVYELSEIEHEVKAKVVTPDQSFKKEIINRLFNLHTALQFLQLDVAKEEYLGITEAYLSLEPEEQNKIYGKVKRAYYEVKYVSETME